MKWIYSSLAAKSFASNWEVKEFAKLAYKFHVDVLRVCKENNTGFEFKDTRTIDCTAKIFIHKELNLICKIGGTTCFLEYNDYFPQYCIDTCVVRDANKNLVLRFQPIADVSKKAINKAYKFIYSIQRDCRKGKLDEIELLGGDPHDGNVAMYNGKMVVIDW
jgi:hypothetical protein